MVDVALAVVLLACGYALWVRRHTWGSLWDTNPSRILILIGCAGLLASPLGPTRVDPLAHRMFGLWNVAGLLTVLCMFCAVLFMYEHLVTRLSDDDHARLLGRRHIATPLKFGLPLVIMAFWVADRGQPEYLDVFAPRGPWFGVYWALIAVLTLYVFGFISRVLLKLRRDPRSRASANLYLIWAAFKPAAIFAQLTCVLLDSPVTLPTWICACVSATAFVYAATRSWRARADSFQPFMPKTPEVAGD